MDGGYEDLHVLGYGIDHRSALLQERLRDARADRERRADAMAARLRELGFAVDPAPIEARKQAGKPVGRPHLAAAVLAHPDNAERLAEEGHESVSTFIPAYLIQGTPGYVARSRPTVEEAIGWIHDAAGRGGLGASVLGHPEDEARCWARSTATRPPGSTAWRSSTRRTPRSRRCCWPTAAPSWACSAPAPPTTTAPTTSCSAASGRSTSTVASPTSARSPTARSRRRPAAATASASGSPACRGRASPPSAASPPASFATAATAWRCSTATTFARTSATGSGSRARTAR